MRYYDIALSDTGSATPNKRWTSHPGGIFDPEAQNIEFDIPVAALGAPMGAQRLTIEGISLEDLQQPQAYTGNQLLMKGGMQAGLPLANAKQAGPLLAGRVFQSFANWEGTEMTLDFVLTPTQYTPSEPGNFVLNWVAGTKLSDALQQTLSVAFPDLPISINISDQIVANRTIPHASKTLTELAQFILQLTDGQFLGASYTGVSVVAQNGKILVFDSTYTPEAIQLQFTDFVGQPAWIDVNQMQLKLVMRGDLQVGGRIKMPQLTYASDFGPAIIPATAGIVQTAATSAPSSLNNSLTFQGTFSIIAMRHIGNYRSPDGASWVTVVNCVPVS
ncbi:hypothetical protein AWB78_01344 [Caballeronia calidae]|uniref:Uncharacterized protein n=1 Tax=Caballeronia calidae TaxID=1777139 RepID=A0A158A958_9BURK|nr:hypothetical protein [Caballeronia calidae]SAK53627.1 hypothetical protein AWB78_01344 [Caballeronia calidae]